MDPTNEAVKQAIAAILAGKQPQFVEAPSLIFSKNETLSDYSTEILPTLLAPFTNAIHFMNSDIGKAKESCTQFLEEMLLLDVVNRRDTLSEIYFRVANGSRTRNDRLYLKAAISHAFPRRIEWSDRENIARVMRYAFCKCLEVLAWIVAEERLQHTQNTSHIEDSIPEYPTQAYQVDRSGRVREMHVIPRKDNNFEQIAKRQWAVPRSSLLRRRINPTMSLDEYANMVKRNMPASTITHGISSDEDSSSLLEGKDCLASGNTKRMG